MLGGLTMDKPYRNFINGVWESSQSARDVIDPANNRPFASFYEAGQEDVERAVTSSRPAFDKSEWRKNPSLRAKALLRQEPVPPCPDPCRPMVAPLLSRATPSAVSEHSSEFIGCPISRSFTTYCVCLELRSLPSTGVTRLQRYYEPLRHPKAPSLSLAGFQLVIADHALGFPVFRALSLCTCRRHYPGAASGRIASLISSRRIRLPRKGCRVGLRIVLFEDCSAFTRVAACTLALSPIRDTLIEGFSHFVTSMTAPIASGWSDCRVGLAPTGKRRLFTAHTHIGRSRIII